ncbi:MAG TPA: lysophospholipid acyltransferase family protein [Daejeonella sp.]|uniref:lysophospholipid acyltransferase family protein n=1 Tax=Daejeonella sp. TaxID=2805397 RepID=UPI002ED7881F
MNRVTFRITASILYLISLLPFPVLYFFSDILYIFLYYIVKYRRKVVLNNLLNSFPEKSRSEIEQIEKRFYRYLADLMLESVKTISISANEIKKRFVFKNLDNMKTYLQNGRSIIAVSGHYGNWEWGPVAIGLELREKVLVVYKPLSDKRFEELMISMRSRFGSIMVPMKQTLRKVFEYRNEPSVLVLVGDQTPTFEESQYITNFLNQQTAVFLGVEKIALKLKNPIVYFSINRIKRGYYECVIKSLIDNPEQTKDHEITEAHTRELEKNIRFQPEYWLWSHKRWKFSPENLKND